MKKRILCLTLGLMLTISQAVPAGAASRKDQLKQDTDPLSDDETVYSSDRRAGICL